MCLPRPGPRGHFLPADGSFDLVPVPWCENSFFKTTFFVCVETNTQHISSSWTEFRLLWLFSVGRWERGVGAKLKGSIRKCSRFILWCTILEVSFWFKCLALVIFFLIKKKKQAVCLFLVGPNRKVLHTWWLKWLKRATSTWTLEEKFLNLYFCILYIFCPLLK